MVVNREKRGFERLNAYAKEHSKQRVLIEMLQFLEIRGKRVGEPVCATLEETLKNASRSRIAFSGEIIFFPMLYDGLNALEQHPFGFIEEKKEWKIAVYYFIKGITTKDGTILYHDVVVAREYNKIKYHFPKEIKRKKKQGD